MAPLVRTGGSRHTGLAALPHRNIHIAGETRGNMYFLKIENTYDGLALQEGKTFLSRKGTSDDHGIGLSSVRKIIESHGGDLDLVPGEESFLVGITVGL